MIQTVGVIDQKTGNSDTFWTATLEEYNALTNKDDNTFYNITDDYEDRFNRDLYFQPGETFVNTIPFIFYGYITSGATSIRFFCPSPKKLDNISKITCLSFNGELRGINGYLNSVSGRIEYVGKSGYSVFVNQTEGSAPIGNAFYVGLDKNSAYTNTSNNTPVVFTAYAGGFKLKFE